MNRLVQHQRRILGLIDGYLPSGYTELANKVCPRLRDLATAPAGRIMQPRTNFFGQLCTWNREIY